MQLLSLLVRFVWAVVRAQRVLARAAGLCDIDRAGGHRCEVVRDSAQAAR